MVQDCSVNEDCDELNFCHNRICVEIGLNDQCRLPYDWHYTKDPKGVSDFLDGVMKNLDSKNFTRNAKPKKKTIRKNKYVTPLCPPSLVCSASLLRCIKALPGQKLVSPFTGEIRIKDPNPNMKPLGLVSGGSIGSIGMVSPFNYLSYAGGGGMLASGLGRGVFPGMNNPMFTRGGYNYLNNIGQSCPKTNEIVRTSSYTGPDYSKPYSRGRPSSMSYRSLNPFQSLYVRPLSGSFPNAYSFASIHHNPSYMFIDDRESEIGKICRIHKQCSIHKECVNERCLPLPGLNEYCSPLSGMCRPPFICSRNGFCSMPCFSDYDCDSLNHNINMVYNRSYIDHRQNLFRIDFQNNKYHLKYICNANGNYCDFDNSYVSFVTRFAIIFPMFLITAVICVIIIKFRKKPPKHELEDPCFES